MMLEPKPENLLLAWEPIVQMLVERLGCKKHDLLLALFACSKSPEFDKQMRVYLRERQEK